MSKYAVVKIAGKQYLVRPGTKLKVDKIEPPQKDDTFKFSEVLLYGDEKTIEVGRPFVKDASVSAEFSGTKKAKKVIVFHYGPKTRRRVKKGHRQPYSEILIKEIKL